MKYDLNLTEEQRSEILNDCGKLSQKIVDLIITRDKINNPDCVDEENVVAIDTLLMPITVGLFDQYLNGIRRVVDEQNAEFLCKADNTAELIQLVIKTGLQLPQWDNIAKAFSVYISDYSNDENDGYVWKNTFREACNYLNMMKTRNKLDIGTYGNSQCAHDLVTIINDFECDYTRKVGSILHQYYVGVNDLCKTDVFTQEYIVMWKEKFIDRVNNSNIPETIQTRLKNLIVAKSREIIRDFKDTKIDDQFLTDNDFYFVEQEFFSGKPAWKSKKQHIVNIHMGLEDSKYFYFPHNNYLVSDDTYNIKNKLHFKRLIKS